MNNRNVRIAYTEKFATFTQRGQAEDAGFIRLNGRTISGWVVPDARSKNGKLFITSGINREVPYTGDSGSW